MKAIYGMTTEFARGDRVKITAGPQRYSTGVVDSVRDWPVGRRYRVTDGDERVVVGWFEAESLTKIERDIASEPSKVPADVRDAMISKLMGRAS